MGLRTTLNNKCFSGKDAYSMIHGTIIVSCANVAAVQAAIPVSPVGELARDINANWYICIVANTTWVKINA
jgi:hypothetical protein